MRVRINICIHIAFEKNTMINKKYNQFSLFSVLVTMVTIHISEFRHRYTLIQKHSLFMTKISILLNSNESTEC